MRAAVLGVLQADAALTVEKALRSVAGRLEPEVWAALHQLVDEDRVAHHDGDRGRLECYAALPVTMRCG